MKKKLRAIIIILAALVLAVSLGAILYKLLEYRENEKLSDRAAVLAGVNKLPDMLVTPPSVSSAPSQSENPDGTDGNKEPLQESGDVYENALLDINLSALRDVNSDVCGWLLIPGSVVSYPILQGIDNEYYLTHAWDKSYNSGGSIFVDSAAENNFSGFNTIFYGHRMKNGSMFASIHEYANSEYLDSHPYIYIASDVGVYKYAVYAAYYVYDKVPYTLSFETDSAKQSFIDLGLRSTVIDSGIVPTVNDKIITLSTCTGSYSSRMIVQAVLVSFTASE